MRACLRRGQLAAARYARAWVRNIRSRFQDPVYSALNCLQPKFIGCALRKSAGESDTTAAQAELARMFDALVKRLPQAPQDRCAQLTTRSWRTATDALFDPELAMQEYKDVLANFDTSGDYAGTWLQFWLAKDAEWRTNMRANSA
eukprot:NODE_1316_length_1473_cov_7.084972_g1092_i0.p1 GENE.NODE_1316_length_1473_cov_7.084972_g1092_i0~~NODE_1316_length_1473_cov_7.084972_g1092_i0.p1  ORF type:complete len:145 (-),score=11.61 NODE_1316_length_1473_cov_7.084972_g1092_i0:1012-1446(-)